MLVLQFHHAAAALAQAGAQRVAPCFVRCGYQAGQQAARMRNGLMLQLSAANRADDRIATHGQPSARLARHRASGARDADQQRRGLPKMQQ